MATGSGHRLAPCLEIVDTITFQTIASIRMIFNAKLPPFVRYKSHALQRENSSRKGDSSKRDVKVYNSGGMLIHLPRHSPSAT